MTGMVDRLSLTQFDGDAVSSEAERQEATATGELRCASWKDAETRPTIMEALYWDLAIAPRAVTVEVENGWVTLGGSVTRPFARHRADWAARGAPGVVGLTNKITVAAKITVEGS